MLPSPDYVRIEPEFGSMDARSHYAKGIYSSADLRAHAEWFLAHKDEIPHDFVAVTGKSGMSVAFAALALQDFPLITVRKGESTHGEMIEGTAPKLGRFIVLDDFVSSGETLRRVNRTLVRHALFKQWAEPQFVGGLFYTGKEVWSEHQVRRYRDL